MRASYVVIGSAVLALATAKLTACSFGPDTYNGPWPPDAPDTGTGEAAAEGGGDDSSAGEGGGGDSAMGDDSAMPGDGSGGGDSAGDAGSGGGDGAGGDAPSDTGTAG